MISAWIVAPRDCALSRVSRTSTPAPSPITKPSLSASKGLLAEDGSSFRKDKAFALANPATPSGVILASAPPTDHGICFSKLK